MTYRERLSATVEHELLEIGRRAVAEKRAPNLSAWVNEALARQAEHDRRMKALGQAIEEYEAENGAITDEDIREAERYYAARTIRVRPRSRPKGTAVRRRKGAA